MKLAKNYHHFRDELRCETCGYPIYQDGWFYSIESTKDTDFDGYVFCSKRCAGWLFSICE